jgi:hypothetical protein
VPSSKTASSFICASLSTWTAPLASGSPFAFAEDSTKVLIESISWLACHGTGLNDWPAF